MKYFVYLLHSPGHDKFYIGQTSSLEHRLERHNEFELTNRFTSKYRPWMLKCFVETSSRSDAMRLEKKLKSLKSRRMLAFFVEKDGEFEKYARTFFAANPSLVG